VSDTPPPGPPWPTLGQTLDYLRGLGFVVRAGNSGHLFAQHPTDGSWFVFRDRDPSSPARALELVDLKWQLPGRGFVTDAEFARFWNPDALPAP
jgi:hypothetical protein